MAAFLQLQAGTGQTNWLWPVRKNWLCNEGFRHLRYTSERFHNKNLTFRRTPTARLVTPCCRPPQAGIPPWSQHHVHQCILVRAPSPGPDRQQQSRRCGGVEQTHGAPCPARWHDGQARHVARAQRFVQGPGERLKVRDRRRCDEVKTTARAFVLARLSGRQSGLL